MSLGDWFKRFFSSPEAAEDAADLHEEYGAPDEGEAELEEPGQSSGGAGVPGLASLEGAEIAEADLEELEPPADPAP